MICLDRPGYVTAKGIYRPKARLAQPQLRNYTEAMYMPSLPAGAAVQGEQGLTPVPPNWTSRKMWTKRERETQWTLYGTYAFPEEI